MFTVLGHGLASGLCIKSMKTKHQSQLVTGLGQSEHPEGRVFRDFLGDKLFKP